MVSRVAEYLPITGAVILPNIGGFLGSIVTRRERSWYDNLKKPWFQPPKWLFAPVWTSVYTCMGVSSYLIWREGGLQEQALPLALYGTQLALNWMWSPLFFGGHKMGLALVDIVGLWGSIVASIVIFYPVNRTAALLLLPHLGWISFATLLNYKMWSLNKNDKVA